MVARVVAIVLSFFISNDDEIISNIRNWSGEEGIERTTSAKDIDEEGRALRSCIRLFLFILILTIEGICPSFIDFILFISAAW